MSNKMALDALTAAKTQLEILLPDYGRVHDETEALAKIDAAIAALQAEPTDTSILVRLHRPEGYEDVHPELVLEDANINPAFLPELATPPKD